MAFNSPSLSFFLSSFSFLHDIFNAESFILTNTPEAEVEEFFLEGLCIPLIIDIGVLDVDYITVAGVELTELTTVHQPKKNISHLKAGK